jgi:vacuolar-type H+-ATPase subunit H
MDELVNNYEFAKILDEFEQKEVLFLSHKVDEAFVIMNDPNYKWKDEEQKLAAQARYDAMEHRYKFLREVHTKGMKLVKQHEGIIDRLSGLYQMWYNQISNNGKQEAEMMLEEAKILGEIFEQIYLILEPLKLNFKPPIK